MCRNIVERVGDCSNRFVYAMQAIRAHKNRSSHSLYLRVILCKINTAAFQEVNHKCATTDTYMYVCIRRRSCVHNGPALRGSVVYISRHFSIRAYSL